MPNAPWAEATTGIVDRDQGARLDERFKLAPEVWEKLPQYADWGFAVFELKAAPGGLLARVFDSVMSPKTRSVHPMAFEFPRREPSVLRFPTALHDGEVHETATFDHRLYCQVDAAPATGWESSNGPASKWVRAKRAMGLVDPSEAIYRRTLLGVYDNRDQELGRPEAAPAS